MSTTGSLTGRHCSGRARRHPASSASEKPASTLTPSLWVTVAHWPKQALKLRAPIRRPARCSSSECHENTCTGTKLTKDGPSDSAANSETCEFMRRAHPVCFGMSQRTMLAILAMEELWRRIRTAISLVSPSQSGSPMRPLGHERKANQSSPHRMFFPQWDFAAMRTVEEPTCAIPAWSWLIILEKSRLERSLRSSSPSIWAAGMSSAVSKSSTISLFRVNTARGAEKRARRALFGPRANTARGAEKRARRALFWTPFQHRAGG